MEYLKSGDPSEVYVLIHRAIQDACREGFISELNLQQLSKLLADIQGSVCGVQMYLTTQMSYPFVQMVTLIVYFFLIQLVYVCAGYISDGFANNHASSFVTGYITGILYTFVLFGLLKLDRVLSNPLGNDPADFPCDEMCTNLAAGLSDVRTNSFSLLFNKEKSMSLFKWKIKLNDQMDSISTVKTFDAFEKV